MRGEEATEGACLGAALKILISDEQRDGRFGPKAAFDGVLGGGYSEGSEFTGSLPPACRTGGTFMAYTS